MKVVFELNQFQVIEHKANEFEIVRHDKSAKLIVRAIIEPWVQTPLFTTKQSAVEYLKENIDYMY